MKNFLMSMLLCAASVCASQAQTAPKYRVHEGSKLTYHVEAGSKEYDFIVTVSKLGPAVTFAWEMTDPVNRQGTITMTAEAMRGATSLYNYFSGGDVTLKEETSVFVSAALHKAVMAGDEVMIGAGGAGAEPEKFYKLEGRTSERNGSIYLSMTKEENGKEVNLDGPILENEDGSRAIRYQETDYFPIITFMELDFKIYLTGIS